MSLTLEKLDTHTVSIFSLILSLSTKFQPFLRSGLEGNSLSSSFCFNIILVLFFYNFNSIAQTKLTFFFDFFFALSFWVFNGCYCKCEECVYFGFQLWCPNGYYMVWKELIHWACLLSVLHFEEFAWAFSFWSLIKLEWMN